MSKDFLREIEVPGILEILAERWDNALELMHEDALVYGGVVRDIIAGFALKGDLDIVGAPDPYSHMLYAFVESVKWTPEGWVPPVSSPQGVKSLRGGASEFRITPRPSSRQPSSPSRYPKHMSSPSKYTKHAAVDDTTSFLTFDNAKVQLIKARPSKVTGFKAALQVAKEVDIVCCGFIMDKYGRVFEVVEGAHDDCVNKVLRFNKTAKTLIVSDLKIRVAKLKERGWISKINISRLYKMEEKAAAARRSEDERMLRARKKEGRKDTQQIRDWLLVSLGRNGIPEVVLDIGGLRRSADPGTDLGFIKDGIVAVAKNFGWVKDKNYEYNITGKGIITISVRAGHESVVEYAYTVAERMEEYGGSKPKGGRVWRKPDRPHYSDERSKKTAVVKSSMHDEAGYTTHTHLGEIRGLNPSDEEASDERVEEASDERVEGAPREMLSFKATMAPNGQIEIDTNSTTFGENVENHGGVEIDVSDIPEEAQERVRRAFEDSRRDHQGLGDARSVTSSDEIRKAAKTVKRASDSWGYSASAVTKQEAENE